MNHTLSVLTTKHAHAFSRTVSRRFGSRSSGNEWRLCFTDRLTHLWRRWGNSGCFKLCTKSCRKTWVNTVVYFKNALQRSLVYQVLEINCFIKSIFIMHLMWVNQQRQSHAQRSIFKNNLFFPFMAMRSGSLWEKGRGDQKTLPPQRKQRILTKNGLYPAGATAGTALRGPAAGGSTGRPEEKMPRAFRFKPGIKLACCWADKKKKWQWQSFQKLSQQKTIAWRLINEIFFF